MYQNDEFSYDRTINLLHIEIFKKDEEIKKLKDEFKLKEIEEENKLKILTDLELLIYYKNKHNEREKFCKYIDCILSIINCYEEQNNKLETGELKMNEETTQNQIINTEEIKEEELNLKNENRVVMDEKIIVIENKQKNNKINNVENNNIIFWNVIYVILFGIFINLFFKKLIFILI